MTWWLVAILIYLAMVLTSMAISLSSISAELNLLNKHVGYIRRDGIAVGQGVKKDGNFGI